MQRNEFFLFSPHQPPSPQPHPAAREELGWDVRASSHRHKQPITHQVPLTPLTLLTSEQSAALETLPVSVSVTRQGEL